MTQDQRRFQRPDDRELLRSSLRSMGAPALVDVIFGGLAPEGELRITEVLGGRTRSVVGQRVHTGDGLGGAAMHERKPVRVSDYFASNRITHKFDSVVRTEGLLTMAAIPIVVGKQTRGVLYAATRDRYEIGSGILSEFARVAATVSQEMRVRDEVDRRLAILRVADDEEAGRSRSFTASVREAHAELISIARTTSDQALQDQLLRVAETLGPKPLPQRDAQAPTLSKRQLDVLSQVALGCDYAEVGRRLGLKLVTVRSYMRAITAKLECHNRVEAVAIARKHGLLP